MNRLNVVRRAEILRFLCDGASIRSASRVTATSKATILKLLVEVGGFCSMWQDYRLRDLRSVRVEADEIWAFVGAKQKRARQDGHGDIWTFTAIDADSKLMISWLVGGRTTENAIEFMQDVAARLTNRVQLTTDGHGMYLTAVRSAFDSAEVNYAQLVKKYGQTESGVDASRRYSPPVCIGADKVRCIGRPDPDLISTSYVERANLTIRMQQRRFTRLTNAFSKKAENHAHAVSLYFFSYNFCRPHQTLTKNHPNRYRTTPAMAAGLTNRVWKIEDLLSLMDPATPIA